MDDRALRRELGLQNGPLLRGERPPRALAALGQGRGHGELGLEAAHQREHVRVRPRLGARPRLQLGQGLLGPLQVLRHPGQLGLRLGRGGGVGGGGQGGGGLRGQPLLEGGDLGQEGSLAGLGALRRLEPPLRCGQVAVQRRDLRLGLRGARLGLVERRLELPHLLRRLGAVRQGLLQGARLRHGPGLARQGLLGQGELLLERLELRLGRGLRRGLGLARQGLLGLGELLLERLELRLGRARPVFLFLYYIF